jgi:hypothetical protein
MWKKAAIVLYVIALGVVIYWIAAGGRIFTQSQRMVSEVDPLLGTTTEHWVPDYHPGLDLLGPIAGGLIVIGSAALYFGRRRTAR